MSKRFYKTVTGLNCSLSNSDGWFYERPLNHIISGFVCDKHREVYEISWYALPLYDSIPFLHLGFGGKLSSKDRSIPLIVKGNEEMVATMFLERIEPYRENVNKLKKLDNFQDHIMAIGEESIWLHRARFFTSILSNDEGLIDKCLRDAHDYMSRSRRSEFFAPIYSIEKELMNSREGAIELLVSWENEMRVRLSIE